VAVRSRRRWASGEPIGRACADDALRMPGAPAKAEQAYGWPPDTPHSRVAEFSMMMSSLIASLASSTNGTAAAW